MTPCGGCDTTRSLLVCKQLRPQLFYPYRSCCPGRSNPVLYYVHSRCDSSVRAYHKRYLLRKSHDCRISLAADSADFRQGFSWDESRSSTKSFSGDGVAPVSCRTINRKNVLKRGLAPYWFGRLGSNTPHRCCSSALQWQPSSRGLICPRSGCSICGSPGRSPCT